MSSAIATPTAPTRTGNSSAGFPTTAGTIPTVRDSTLAAVQTRLPASIGETTPTIKVPSEVHHNNSLPPPLTDPLLQLSPFQAPQTSLPSLRTMQTSASSPHSTVASCNHVNAAYSAPADMSIVNTTSRLHVQHHTLQYRVLSKCSSAVFSKSL